MFPVACCIWVCQHELGMGTQNIFHDVIQPFSDFGKLHFCCDEKDSLFTIDHSIHDTIILLNGHSNVFDFFCFLINYNLNIYGLCWMPLIELLLLFWESIVHMDDVFHVFCAYVIGQTCWEMTLPWPFVSICLVDFEQKSYRRAVLPLLLLILITVVVTQFLLFPVQLHVCNNLKQCRAAYSDFTASFCQFTDLFGEHAIDFDGIIWVKYLGLFFVEILFGECAIDISWVDMGKIINGLVLPISRSLALMKIFSIQSHWISLFGLFYILRHWEFCCCGSFIQEGLYHVCSYGPLFPKHI